MTKTEFQDLLHRYKRSTRAEADMILTLERQFPYSQVLHSLAARLSQDHQLENQQIELQLAAVYAADRHVLKEVMAGTLPGVTNGAVNATIDAVDYADVVMEDLKKLHKLKHKFEMMFDHYQQNEAKKAKTTTKEKTAGLDSKKKAVSVPKKKEKPTKLKGKAHKPLTKHKAAAPQKSILANRDTKSVKKRPKSTRADNNDRFISELEHTRRLKPLGSKQQQQIKLIDQFIKAQPSISSARERTANAPAGDLAAFKQGEFGEQIISETLVNILKTQGKKEKAIEVLKKLIWKFPQKKAYFAAQIEELKK